jgi:hypothetical protein
MSRKGDTGLLGRERTHERGADAAGTSGDQHHTTWEAGIAGLGHAIGRSVSAAHGRGAFALL